MATEIVCAIITGMCAIVVSFVGLRVKQGNARVEARAELRRQESLLSLRMMDATLQLSLVTSNALTGGHNNGNVEAAREAARKVAGEYNEFMQGVTAKEVSQ